MRICDGFKYEAISAITDLKLEEGTTGKINWHS
jgi:hypothetical protein